jgi:hypothetical protein
MKTHELKTWPEYFSAVWHGLKNFEVRENDRNFLVGETLELKEFKPCSFCDGTGNRLRGAMVDNEKCHVCYGDKGKYTGRIIFAEITYLLEGGRFGIQEGYCVMGLMVRR